VSMSERNTYKLQNEALCNISVEMIVIKIIIITESNLSIRSDDDDDNNNNNVKL
jgi:hypothetical protein